MEDEFWCANERVQEWHLELALFVEHSGWLAAHDAEVRAAALREAADAVYNYAYQPDDCTHGIPEDHQVTYLAGATDAHKVVDRLLRARADAEGADHGDA